MLETIVGRIFGFFLDLFGQRKQVTFKFSVSERVLAAFVGDFGDSSTLMSRDAELRLHNGGVSRFTVNEAGFYARDGTLLTAGPHRPRTLEPGGEEEVYRVGACQVAQLFTDHGGIGGAYAEIAGSTEPKPRNAPGGWLAQVQAVCRRSPGARSPC